jgi:hypothetical protein
MSLSSFKGSALSPGLITASCQVGTTDRLRGCEASAASSRLR